MSLLPNVECDFDDAPLMLVLAQIKFTQSPELFERITEIKSALCELNLPVAQERQQVNVSLAFGQNVPSRTTQSTVWWFTSLDKLRAMAITQNSVVLYDAKYTRFAEFRQLVQGVIEPIIGVAGKGCFLTTVALRYLSGFASDGIPSPYISPGLRGLPVDQLSTDHFHHDYSFWCSTQEEGRLALKLKTVHGHELIPRDLKPAGIVFDPKFMLPKTTDAVQLDIFETVQRKAMRKLDLNEIDQMLAGMQQNIKRSFLLATTSEGHEKWKIRN